MRCTRWLRASIPEWVPTTEEFALFAYQHKPPYVVDAERGAVLYFDLAELLYTRLPQRRFVVSLIPRRRPDHGLVACNPPGLVLGARPKWFADAERHLWSQAVIDDANQPLRRYQRRLLVPVQHAALIAAQQNRILRSLPENAEWQAHLWHYR